MKEDEDVAVIEAINMVLRACIKDTSSINISEVAFNIEKDAVQVLNMEELLFVSAS